MSEILTRDWWAAAAIRALRTVAQTAVALIGTATAITDVAWPVIASGSLLAGILSLLTSLAGLPEVDAVPGGEGRYRATEGALMSGGGSNMPMMSSSPPGRPGSKLNLPPSGPSRPDVLACDCARVRALIALAAARGDAEANVRLTAET